MRRVLRPNYAQRFLLPPALDEWVPPSHPVRFVSDFVDALNLPEVGIHEPAAERGRPPFAPELLLKVWLFGYMERIRSSRALEKACVQVMPFLWLTGLLHPDHNTLWRFFHNNQKALPQLFKMLVKTAAKAGLVGFALHALDGTKLVAASSTDTAQHRKALEERLKRINEHIAAYMEEVARRSEDDKPKDYTMPAAMADAGARQEKLRALLVQLREEQAEEEPPSGAASTTEPLPLPTTTASEEATAKPATTPGDDDEPKGMGGGAATSTPSAPSPEPPEDPLLREAEALRQQTAAKLAKLDEADVPHLHEAEPEARMMKGRGGLHALGYNAQIVVDHDSDLIVASEVSADQNDLGQLVPMLSEVHDTLGRVAEQTVADNGYASGEQLQSAEDKALAVLVALREEPEQAGAYDKSSFRYDAEQNVYVCPQGEQLVQIGTSKSHASTKVPDAIYRCSHKACPVRAQCTTSARGRQIRRPYGEEARARQAHKQADPRMRLLLGLRKEIVEHLFGIVKTIDGFRRFTVRGLEKARAQWALVCMAVNLRKLAASATWNNGTLMPRDGAALAAGCQAS